MTNMLEAGRNFQWRVAGVMLRMLAWQNMAIEDVEKLLGWDKDKLKDFLISAVLDDGRDLLTIKDIAELAFKLDFHIELSFAPNPESKPEVEVLP